MAAKHLARSLRYRQDRVEGQEAARAEGQVRSGTGATRPAKAPVAIDMLCRTVDSPLP